MPQTGALRGELLAVDGTRLKAVNSTERNFTHAKLAKQLELIDQKLTDYLERLDRCDAQEAEPSAARAERLTDKIASLHTRQMRCHTMLQELERTGESQISLTDPDSRAMAMHPKVGVGYNAQVAVDSKHKLIVEQEVTNAGSDLGLLAPTASAAKEVLEAEQIKVVADSGYYKGEDIAACEAAGMSVRYNYRLRFAEALPQTAEKRVDFSLGSQARRVLIARCQPRRKPPPAKTPLANPCNPMPHWPQWSAKTLSPGPN